jgi:hypothetical protein
MNTPSHLILNLAILYAPYSPPASASGAGEATQNQGNRRGRHLTLWPILIGAFLPDLALFVFYGWAKLFTAAPESVIWDDLYYTDTWQDIFAVGNSVPLALLGLGLALGRGWPWLRDLCSSMLLHHAADLPLHNADAHRHFWPFSNWRFMSPVSYWDVDHYGAYAALGEWLLVAIATAWLWRRGLNWWTRGLLLAVNGCYGVLYYQFYGSSPGPF